jgi:hypothetical protein
MIRLCETRVSKEVFESKPEERRESINPRLGSLEGTDNDLRVLKVKRWRQYAITEKNGHLR